MSRAVLDASAVLAWTFGEDGHEAVADSLRPASAISAVNWSEVLQKIAARGADADQLGERLLALGLQIAPFGPNEARTTAKLYPHTRTAVGLALARQLELPALTGDRAWKDLDLDVTVQLIR